MKFQIFKKAELLKNKVMKEGESRVDNTVFFTFKLLDAPSLSMITNGKFTYITCTCQHCSIFAGLHPEALCAYKLAVIKHLK